MRHVDMSLLCPPFRVKVERVLVDLTTAGFNPRVWETLRSPEKAAENARKGVGSARSMHIYGCAVDIICKTHRWGCYKHKCEFFEKLGHFSRAHGLYWGGDWKSRDCPHVQAIPVKLQDELRAAKTPQDRNLFLEKFYAGSK